MKKIINYILTTITILLFVLTFTILIVGIKANKENKIAKIFGYSYSVVPTNSMEDTINIGDIVISKEKNFSEIKIDDIVVFYSPEKKIHIVHRVIDIDSDGNLITKGDNNSNVDEEVVLEENYVGTIVKIIPNIGNLVLNYRNYIFIIIIIIFIYIIIREIINIVKNINASRREKLEAELKEKYKDVINDGELDR